MRLKERLGRHVLLALMLIALLTLIPSPHVGWAAALQVSTTADSGPGSLRDTVAAAGAGDVITFAPSLGTITVSGAAITLDKDLTIVGPGAAGLTIQGNSGGSVFSVNSGISATITGLTVSSGYIGIENHGALVLGAVNVLHNGGDKGHGISNDGTLRMSYSTVAGNTADQDRGGGISNDGTLDMAYSTVAGNTAGLDGGGIYNTSRGVMLVGLSTVP